MGETLTFSRKRALAAALCAVFLAGCLRNPVSNKSQVHVVSEKAEREIGLETKKEILKEYGEFKDPVLSAYVSRVGARLVAVCDRPRLDYQFTIVDQDVVNAFAAPGGYIFVTRGLLERMDNEAELALVMGHEVGHVCALHGVNMVQREMGAGVLTALGAIATAVTAGPEAMIALAQTAELFSDLYLLGYSRENELEADRLGLRYALSAGYDARAALSFFRKLEKMEKQSGDDAWEPYLRDHPPTQTRIQLAQDYLDRMDEFKRPAAEVQGEFQAQKARLPKLAPGERGRVEGNRFVHPGLGISLEIPDKWTWEVQNQRVLASFLSPRDGAWGELRRVKLGGTMPAMEFARRLGSDRRWKSLRGREALYPVGYVYIGNFAGAGPMGDGYAIHALFVVRGSVGYALICGVPPDHETEYLLPFEGIMRSFQLP
jgi:predicted Zn-dependent protease